VRVCVCAIVWKRKKIRRTRRYLSCGDTCGWVSLQIALIVYISCLQTSHRIVQDQLCGSVSNGTGRRMKQSSQASW